MRKFSRTKKGDKKINNSKTILKGTKRLFLKLGTCSRLFFYILNREFGYPKETEERAADPLAGGIMQRGHQCGMLWGAALAVGAESFRRYDDRGQAIGTAITATQHVMESFKNRAKSHDCYDITDCNWSSKTSIAKYFVTGKMMTCFKLLEKWAPEAIQAAREGLSREEADLPKHCLSCASEVVKKMGGVMKRWLWLPGLPEALD